MSSATTPPQRLLDNLHPQPPLAALARDDLARLRPHLEAAALSLGEVPTELGCPITHVLSSGAGIISMLAVTPGKRRRIKAGLIGREGIMGLSVVLGAEAELHEALPLRDAYTTP